MEVRLGGYVYAKAANGWTVQYEATSKSHFFCFPTSPEAAFLGACAERDSEIAKLRAERDEARTIIESSFDQANRIASMVGMSQWPRNQAPGLSNFLSTIADMTSIAVCALAAARAALDGEREACDAIRAVLNPDALGCVPGSAPMIALDWCRAHDERRAIVKPVKS